MCVENSDEADEIVEFWSAEHDGSMRNRVNIVTSQPLLNITDAKSLLALSSDYMMCRAKQQQQQQGSCQAATGTTTSVPLLSGGLCLVPSFVTDNPASDPSSSEWAVDLDHGCCLKYIHRPTRKNSNVSYFNQVNSRDYNYFV